MKPAQQQAVTETQQKVIAGLTSTLLALEAAKQSMSMNVPGYGEISDRMHNLRKQIEQLRDSYGQPEVAKPSAYFIVWNDAKTEGFVTTDGQLAYEVRKGSSSNCYDAEGRRSDLGKAMIEHWGDDTCSIETVVRQADKPEEENNGKD